MSETLTQERLKELISYDPETGVFIWVAGAIKKGRAAGWVENGYVKITINGKNYKAHRLAWLWEKGAFPSSEIDHKNGIRADNRIENLRECSRQENQWNTSAYKNNKTGFKGVSEQQSGWRATIRIGGKQVYLGEFASAIEAGKAYEAKARELHGEFYREVSL